MGLSDDQKAILRLLSQRGESGYEDLAALMGVGVDEVHAKAVDAAAQLEAEGIPAPAIPAPPGAPAPAAERPPPAAPEPPPAPAEPAAPEPESTPADAAPPIPVPPPKRPAPPRGSTPPRIALPSGGGARAAIFAGLAVVVALVVVLLVSGGDSDGGSTTAAEGASGAETPASTTAAEGKGVTKAVLEPVDGGDGAGVALFGRVKESVVLQVAAEGLEPTAAGESYTVWLSQSPQKMLPLATTTVSGNGQIGARTEIPAEVLGFLANETFGDIAITRTVDSQLRASLKKATSEKKAPDYTGTEVLRGTVTGPIVGAAKRQEEAE